jgi:hypothetical protein
LAELKQWMKAFIEWFENHRHILALSFVSYKFAAREFDREIVAGEQCFNTIETRRGR